MSLESIKDLKKIQDKYFFRLPHGYIIADYVFPGVIMSPCRVRDLSNMEFGPNDVVIATYPKSGTTWMSELLSALVYGGDMNVLLKFRQDIRVPWLEMENKHWWISSYLTIENLFRGSNLADQKKPQRRVCFTHLPLDLLPNNVINSQCRFVYVSRNPKDNAVSFFHFHRMARFLGLQKDLNWNDFFALYTSGSLYCGSWFEHVLGFWRFANLNQDRVHFVKYEDMIHDLSYEAHRIIEFLKLQLTEEQITRALEHCSFNSMKENRMANRDISWLFDQKISKFMRSGKVGDWKNYFTLVQNDLFDSIYREKMAGSELEFRFE